MRKIYLAPALALLLPLLAQSAAAQRPASRAADYFPLRVGDSWTYRINEDETQFTVKVLSAEKQADGTMLYLVEKLAGVQIHSWHSKPFGWVLTHKEAYPQQDGLHVEHQPAKQQLKNPLVAGQKWTWKGKGIGGLDLLEINEVFGPERVTTQAGTFRAIKVVSKVTDGDSGVTRTNWYADGVGLVKSQTESATLKYGWELVDYSFKPKRVRR
jgi:hypothetical protein